MDEDGDVLDILVQLRRDRRAAKRFFRKLLKQQGCEPRRLRLIPRNALTVGVPPPEVELRGGFASFRPSAHAIDRLRCRFCL